MIQEYFLLAINSIFHRKLRSWLTIIGIIIGVAAIISLITISRGLENSITSQFEQFGANRILISAKGFQGPGTASQGLTTKDVDTIKKISGFKYVIPLIIRSSEVKSGKETGFTLIYAIPSENVESYFTDSGIKLQTGRLIKSDDKYSAIIGARVAKEMFSKELRIGNKIQIGKQDFKIVGILEEIGNSQDDNQIGIPLDSAREIFNDQDNVDSIIAQAKSDADVPSLQKRIEKELKQKRDDTNFQVRTASQILEQINNVLGIVQIVLVGIAAISLIVGAIGIMNSMYTSVLERTKDIGVMKAVGARNSDIMGIFLIESGLMGLVGGIFGTALGTAVALIVGKISLQAGFLLIIKIEFSLLLFGLLFAFFMGMISGALPAYQASKLRPVDALRYE
ncbi:MAG: ABC transporter permease [Nanoarchaeota archaeon]